MKSHAVQENFGYYLVSLVGVDRETEFLYTAVFC